MHLSEYKIMLYLQLFGWPFNYSFTLAFIKFSCSNFRENIKNDQATDTSEQSWTQKKRSIHERKER